MTGLFTPMQIKGVTLKNRIVMSPMCMYSCMDEDGIVQPWHKTHYTSRAVGGAGLIMVEATGVTPQGRITQQDLGIWSDEHIVGLTELTESAHTHGAVIGIQLAHAGRKSVTNGTIVAPSAIPFDQKSRTPEALTATQIGEVVEAFAQGAVRARKAGFDIIEIHAAHGYLINQFLSPLSNTRDDEWGGDRDGRFRLLEQVVKSVQREWSGPLFVRLSVNEYAEGGLTPEDHVYNARRLKELGVDLVDCSSGGLVHAGIESYPGYQVPYAEKLRREAGIATGAVGLITDPTHADEIIRNGRADLVFLARELLRDPYWPIRAAHKLRLPDAVKPPRQYERAWL